MSTYKPEFEYDGLRRLLLPKYLHLSMGYIGREDRQQALKAVESFVDKHVVLIYRESENKFRGEPRDNYVNCTFIEGRLRDLKSEALILSDANIRIDDLMDLIPLDTLGTDTNVDPTRLRMFNFNSIDPHKVADIYNIVHTDPVNAFLSRLSGDDPLYLSSAEKLHPGMQFNSIRDQK